MSKKIRVGILFGGRSAEHEVSLQSAKSVIDAIDKEKYEVVPLAICKNGTWFSPTSIPYILNHDNPKLVKLNRMGEDIALVPGNNNQQLVALDAKKAINKVDVIFPILHGTYGEDGSIQGLCRMANIPFVGANIIGSAVGMDKDVSKRLLKAADIPIADFLVFNKMDKREIIYSHVKSKIGTPLFIKPANLGSSVGIKKVYNEKDFYEAVEHAFQFDNKIVIEENISGREIECSVLGNESPIVSVPGEIIPRKGDFYSYEAKYIDESGAELKIPAKLPIDVAKAVRNLAIKSYKVLCCDGMARVDSFITEDYKIYINEINTIPGFTSISMYPKLWEATGIPYSELIERLINLAIDRFEQQNNLKTRKEF